MRSICILCVVVGTLVGCGPSEPTPEERYNTALSIYEKERDELARIKPLYDAAGYAAEQTVCRELLGYSQQDVLSGAQAELEKMRDENERGVTKTPEQVSAETKTYIADMKERTERTMTVLEMGKKISEAGTPENDRWRKLMEKMPVYAAYHDQRKRVKRAEDSVAAAEKALGK